MSGIQKTRISYPGGHVGDHSARRERNFQPRGFNKKATQKLVEFEKREFPILGIMWGTTVLAEKEISSLGVLRKRQPRNESNSKNVNFPSWGSCGGPQCSPREKFPA